jgi:GntR family transcriptional regulator, transcriptional repressor for pyruvate dehydrogenase complex
LAALINGHEPSLEELLEVRLGLECQAAVLAAQRATEQDLAAIAKCLDDMLAEHDHGRLGIEADVSFHMAIAYATKNLARVHIMRTFIPSPRLRGEGQGEGCISQNFWQRL